MDTNMFFERFRMFSITLMIVIMHFVIADEPARAGTVQVELSSDDFRTETGRLGGEIIRIDGFYSRGKPGAPILPQYVYDIALPPDTDWKTVRIQVTDKQEIDVPGLFNLEPAPPAAEQNDGKTQVLDWGDAGEIVNGQDISIYRKDAFYPETCVELKHCSQMRKWKFIRVQFTPVSFNPVLETLKRIKRATLEVTFDSTGNDEPDALLQDNIMDERARERFVNFNQAEKWYQTKQRDTRAWTYNYVIITTSEFVSKSVKLAEFIHHKDISGFSPLVVTEDDYGGLTAPFPNWIEDKIRQWLIENYIQYQIEYVLIIGDPRWGYAGTPMKLAYENIWGLPTDLYFADLTGNWDLDGDGYYAEPVDDWGVGGVDVTAEVYVGRIPLYSYDAVDISKVDDVLQKTMDYQSATGALSWRKKFLLPEGFSGPGTDGAYLGETMWNDYLQSNGCTRYTMYQQGECVDDSIFSSNEELRDASTVNYWKNSPCGFVTYWDHGSPTHAEVGYGDNGCGILLVNWDSFQLNDDYPSIVFQIACSNAHPETENNLAYSLLLRGAVAVVGATRTSHYEPGWTAPIGEQCNPDNGYEFNRNMVVRDMTAAEALYAMKSELDVWGTNLYVYNLFGDPQIHHEQNGTVQKYYVDHVNGSDTYTGLSWSQAFATIQKAVSMCGYGSNRFPDKIYVAAATYYENVQFSNRSNIFLIGGYPPGGGLRDPDNNITTIQSDGTNRALYSSYGEDLFFDGFRIAFGIGGYFQYCTDITFANCHFYVLSGTRGAGIESHDSSIRTHNCVFSFNDTSGEGAAIYCEDSRLDVINSLFLNNEASNGGGISAKNTKATIQNCTFVENSASGTGGGVYDYVDTEMLVIVNSIFWDNTPNQIMGDPEVSYCDVQGGYPGGSYILNVNPLFVMGPRGSYYLSQMPAGQSFNSPCVDAGSCMASSVCFPVSDGLFRLSELITRSDEIKDSDVLDMGYHYMFSGYYLTPTPTPTGSPTPTNTSTPTKTPTPRIIRVPTDYSTIQAGIDAANSHDTVLVADGIYTGAGNKNLNYNGKPVVVMSENGYENCVIDCQNDGRGFQFGSDETRAAVVDGFTIRNGRMVTAPDYYGGAIVMSNDAAPVIRNCLLTGNEATRGGAVYSFLAAPHIHDCIITGNTSETGGGLSLGSGNAIIENCDVFGNIATVSGGGFHVLFTVTAMKLTNCTIDDNTAPEGGGIYVWYTHFGPAISNCQISGNTATRGGGIFCHDHAKPFFFNCTASGNSASAEGGGMYCDDNSDPEFENCILYGDTSGIGQPEIYNDGGAPVASYSDIQQTSGVYPGEGNINQNPLFVAGPHGDFCLDQTSKALSPCVNTGSGNATDIFIMVMDDLFRMSDLSTRTDGRGDYGTVDMGVHYMKTLYVPDQYPSIQAAIDVALDGQTVMVADGIYTGNRNKNLNFEGKKITLTSQNGPDTCVIDCENNGRGFYFCTGETQDSIVQGFTIRNGAAIDGGGIFILSSSPTIDNCHILQNTASNYGGGVYANQSHGMICDCKITHNTADEGGGLIIKDSENLIVADCIIENNTSTDIGGGIRVLRSDHQLINCIIAENSTINEGGGIYVGASSETNCLNCTFSQNTASSGGALFCTDIADATITNCILWGDTATYSNEIHDYGDVDVLYCCIEGGWLTGSGVIDQDPLWVPGRYGNYYLDSSSKGTSPCIDSGYDLASQTCFKTAAQIICMDALTAQINELPDKGTVDMGYHYSGPEVYEVPGEYGTIQPAIDAASDGEIVAVADGTYTGAGNTNLDFHGKSILVRSVNGPSHCIIDCQNISRGFYFHSGEDEHAILTGFTIRNGYSATNGAGIYVFNSAPGIMDCVIEDSTADERGGGIYAWLGSPDIIDCRIIGNHAGLYGGGLFLLTSSSEITNLLATGNSAGNRGGGVYCGESNPAIGNSTFSGNTAVLNGGALCCENSSPLISNSILYFDTPEEVYNFAGGSPQFSYSDIQGGWGGPGNKSQDPQFAAGPLGSYYLSSAKASPCIDAGSDDSLEICFPAVFGNVCMNQLTTRVDEVLDTGTVDMGYHYEKTSLPSPTPTPVPTSTPTPVPIIRHVPSEYTTIQLAIDACIIGDIVLVADGTYTGIGNREINFNGKAISVESEHGPLRCIIDCENVTHGFHFVNGETVTSKVQGFTIQNGNGIQYGGGIHISESSPTIDNCIFKNNYAPNNGGGIWCYSSNATITNCLFTGNSSFYGGAIHCKTNSEVMIRDCTIENNTATQRTGGIYVGDTTDVTITNTILWNNSHEEIYLDATGTVIVTYSDVELTSGVYPGSGNINSDPLFTSISLGNHYLSHLAAGQASDSPCINAGGEAASSICFFSVSGSICMDDVTTRTDQIADAGQADMGFHYPPGTVAFVRHVPSEYATIQLAVDACNTSDVVLVADGTYTGIGNREINFNGKAISVESEHGPLRCIIDCEDVTHGFHFTNGETATSKVQGFTIQNGNGVQYGGGIHIFEASPTIANCIFNNNHAPTNGGGIWCYSSNTTITNCLFTGNSSFYGAAIHCKTDSTVLIKNCTIENNTANARSGGVYVGDTTDVTITNTILWNNSQEEIYLDATGTVIVTYSDVELTSGVYPGTGNINSDPLFASISLGNHYLSHLAAGQASDSPCINAGGSVASGICFDTVNGVICLDDLTTRTDQTIDAGQVDMGFHHRPDASVPTSTPLPPTNTPLPPTNTPLPPTNTSGPSNTPTQAPVETDTPVATQSPNPTSTPEGTSTPAHHFCPTHSIYSQTLDLMDPMINYWDSDEDLESTVYDNYSATEDICDIHWWGVCYPVESQPSTDYTITFYINDGNWPGSLFAQQSVTATYVNIGDTFYGDPIYYFSAELTPCVTLPAGWVSVCSVADGIDFYWLTSPDGDDLMVYGSDIYMDPYMEDMAFCLTAAEPTQTPVPTHSPTPPCINHGDTNLNGIITAGDAQLTFYIVLGIYTPTYDERCAADCTGDEIVTAADAQAIFFWVLGLGVCADPL
ncbi:right-handed parallel beta-helix repeat-containing protein [bacterium]|nr:right-handed parallel beta-helix repeat-containing protein [candidate division CSSED10-310 bacterium]